jgi:hypothetical protein
MALCPYCGNTTPTYTDPRLQVRCTVCFNYLQGTPGTPIGRMIDTEAPMVIAGRTYAR